MRHRLVLLICAACALPACERFGYSSRVLLRVPSPDGRIVAVCQEIPEFDGPSFDIRAERPDGTRIRQLLRGGDGDPCSELAWSPDGRVLAVLSTHVARVRVADVARMLEQPATASSRWAWRRFNLAGRVRGADPALAPGVRPRSGTQGSDPALAPGGQTPLWHLGVRPRSGTRGSDPALAPGGQTPLWHLGPPGGRTPLWPTVW